MKILHMTLKRKYFDLIASGKKTEEYREYKLYWLKKFLKCYDAIQFRNGYATDAPTLLIEVKRVGLESVLWKDENVIQESFVIYLGKIIKIKNYDGPRKSENQDRKKRKILAGNRKKNLSSGCN